MGRTVAVSVVVTAAPQRAAIYHQDAAQSLMLLLCCLLLVLLPEHLPCCAAVFWDFDYEALANPRLLRVVRQLTLGPQRSRG